MNRLVFIIFMGATILNLSGLEKEEVVQNLAEVSKKTLSSKLGDFARLVREKLPHVQIIDRHCRSKMKKD